MAACIWVDPADIRTVLAAPNGVLQHLDVRRLDDFLAQRVRAAVHVPPEDLAKHCFCLPDKDEVFGIVLPCDSNLPIQECPDLPTFLHTRGWARVAWCIKDCPALWQIARELGVWEGGEAQGFTKPRLLQRFAFKPCPLLQEEIDSIEQYLMQDMAADQQVLLPGQPADGADGPGGEGTDAPITELRCLEPGCGSGRNIVWLAARHPETTTPSNHSHAQQGAGTAAAPQQQEAEGANGLVQGEVQAGSGSHTEGGPNTVASAPAAGASRRLARWSVVGIDSWYASLVRVQQLCQSTLIPPTTAQFWHASIDPGSGLMQPLTLGPTTKHAAGAALNTHIPSPAPEGLQPGHWHLILCVRFLERAFLAHIPTLLAPGGFLLFNTFLDMEGTRRFGRPKGSNHLLQRHELAALFGPAQGFEILRDDVALCREGRELCMFAARKLPA